MDYIFYFVFLLVLVVWNYAKIFSPSGMLALRERVVENNRKNELNEKLGKIKEKISFDDMFWIFNQLFYIVLVLIGLLTSQWLGFLALLFIGLISYTLRKILYFKKLQIIWCIIDGIACLLIGIFIILNKFHFHLTATEILKWFGL